MESLWGFYKVQLRLTAPGPRDQRGHLEQEDTRRGALGSSTLCQQVGNTVAKRKHAATAPWRGSDRGHGSWRTMPNTNERDQLNPECGNFDRRTNKCVGQVVSMKKGKGKFLIKRSLWMNIFEILVVK